MLIAAISDIHGNKYALDIVLDSILQKEVDMVVNCGDICGYYFQQNEVMKQLRQYGVYNEVLGNHDYMFLKFFKSNLTKNTSTIGYDSSYLSLAKNITSENLVELKNMQRSVFLQAKDSVIFLSHSGVPENLDTYYYEDSLDDKLLDNEAEIVVFGHTHYAFVKQMGSRLIVNPGSVGQPRDGKPPSYAMIDTNRKKAEIFRVKYDTEKLKADLLRMGEDKGYKFEVIDRWR